MSTQKMEPGFTLVEIMIVVAIIAILAAIAIPNLLRARMTANDALAKTSLRAISTAAELFVANNSLGYYPVTENDLLVTTPPYLNTAHCTGNPIAGYVYDCAMNSAGYTITATPVLTGSTGSAVFTITTGGVLT